MIAITGANGFMGRHLIERLEIDRVHYLPIRHEALEDRHSLFKIFSDNVITGVYHFSAYGNHSTQREEDKILQANVTNLMNLLNASRDSNNLRFFVNISTSSVYGKSEKEMSETDCPKPETFYAITKHSGEMIAKYWAEKYKMPIVNVRPFSVYGEYEAGHRFIPTVITSLKNKATINLDPNPNHDWIYIQDFLDGVEVCVNNIDLLNGKSVNIGTGKQHTNKQIVNMLEELYGEQLMVNITENMRSYDNNNWIADVHLLKSFGWRPMYTLEDGLQNVLDMYEE